MLDPSLPNFVQNYDKDVEVTLTDSQPAAPPPLLPAVKQEYIRQIQQQPVARQKSVNWAASGDLAQPRSAASACGLYTGHRRLQWTGMHCACSAAVCPAAIRRCEV